MSIETGLLGTGEKSCGVFITGLDAYEYKNAIRIILQETTCENTLIVGQLKELMDLFALSDERSENFSSDLIQLVKKL